ncbi:MAG: hypothetical protein EAZ92_11110 [Candidatus Kapaibacterium sp.]|nr:MAG: hypothetical protein EAZ92_11110 [Candidatus Kapabacteria bacterium]
MRFPNEECSSETFKYGTFSCDVDFFIVDEMFGFDAIDIDIPHNPLHITARFYDVSNVHATKDVHDLVALEKSFGTITVEIRTDDVHSIGFTGGFLDASIFTTQDMVRSAVYFVQDYLAYWMIRDGKDVWRQKVRDAGFYHHVCLFERVGVVEYNGTK